MPLQTTGIFYSLGEITLIKQINKFPLQRETNPLFRAVLSNDLNELKALVESGNSVNIQNTKGSALLNFVMRRKR